MACTYHYEDASLPRMPHVEDEFPPLLAESEKSEDSFEPLFAPAFDEEEERLREEFLHPRARDDGASPASASGAGNHAAPSNDTWKCPACTFENALSDLKCDVCTEPRPKEGDTSVAAPGAGTGLSADDDAGSPGSGGDVLAAGETRTAKSDASPASAASAASAEAGALLNEGAGQATSSTSKPEENAAAAAGNKASENQTLLDLNSPTSGPGAAESPGKGSSHSGSGPDEAQKKAVAESDKPMVVGNERIAGRVVTTKVGQVRVPMLDLALPTVASRPHARDWQAPDEELGADCSDKVERLVRDRLMQRAAPDRQRGLISTSSVLPPVRGAPPTLTAGPGANATMPLASARLTARAAAERKAAMALLNGGGSPASPGPMPPTHHRILHQAPPHVAVGKAGGKGRGSLQQQLPEELKDPWHDSFEGRLLQNLEELQHQAVNLFTKIRKCDNCDGSDEKVVPLLVPQQERRYEYGHPDAGGPGHSPFSPRGVAGPAPAVAAEAAAAAAAAAAVANKAAAAADRGGNSPEAYNYRGGLVDDDFADFLAPPALKQEAWTGAWWVDDLPPDEDLRLRRRTVLHSQRHLTSSVAKLLGASAPTPKPKPKPKPAPSKAMAPAASGAASSAAADSASPTATGAMETAASEKPAEQKAEASTPSPDGKEDSQKEESSQKNEANLEDNDAGERPPEDEETKVPQEESTLARMGTLISSWFGFTNIFAPKDSNEAESEEAANREESSYEESEGAAGKGKKGKGKGDKGKGKGKGKGKDGKGSDDGGDDKGKGKGKGKADEEDTGKGKEGKEGKGKDGKGKDGKGKDGKGKDSKGKGKGKGGGEESDSAPGSARDGKGEAGKGSKGSKGGDGKSGKGKGSDDKGKGKGKDKGKSVSPSPRSESAGPDSARSEKGKGKGKGKGSEKGDSKGSEKGKSTGKGKEGKDGKGPGLSSSDSASSLDGGKGSKGKAGSKGEKGDKGGEKGKGKGEKGKSKGKEGKGAPAL